MDRLQDWQLWLSEPDYKDFSGGKALTEEKRQPGRGGPDPSLVLEDRLRPKFVTNLWKLGAIKIGEVI